MENILYTPPLVAISNLLVISGALSLFSSIFPLRYLLLGFSEILIAVNEPIRCTRLGHYSLLTSVCDSYFL